MFTIKLLEQLLSSASNPPLFSKFLDFVVLSGNRVLYRIKNKLISPLSVITSIIIKL